MTYGNVDNSPIAADLAGCALMVGVINRTKAIVGGRTRPAAVAAYYDLWKLLGKGAVYSRTTTWVFRAGPMTSLAGVLLAATLVPFGPCRRWSRLTAI